jgi:peptidyl-dipeptidase A
MKNIFIITVFISAILSSCNSPSNQQKNQEEVQTYLEQYNATYQKLLKISSEAEWRLNTKIVEGDSLTSKAAEESNEIMAKFTGSKENIEKATKFLTHKNDLTPIQIKQLEVILYKAGSNPEIVADVVKNKIIADTKQTENLFGFDYQINGKSVSTNEIDGILRDSQDLNERLIAWNASKEVGKNLKDGLVNLRSLRNQSVQALNYPDFFSYQVSEYDMTSEEMITLCRNLVKEVWPLYRELHTWARYQLAQKYNQPVPELLPAHWISNRWGQDWSNLVEISGYNLDDELGKKSPEWIVEQGEKFYMSLGFDSLPSTFWERSSLYPLPADANYKKNNHASAWHMDNDKDVRSLMSVEPNTEWWETTLHELGHIYYFMSYSKPEIPIILREGANRAYHEAIGSLIGMASLQEPFLREMGLLNSGVQTDKNLTLLKEALNYIVLIPWGAGVMTEFEHELYAKNLDQTQFNQKWWELTKNLQGIAPPTDRDETYCDAATKTHINNDPAQYYDYALSTVLLFQFHDHIANNILKQSPYATNYNGDKKVGQFLENMMKTGSTQDWRSHLKENLGSELSAQSMMNYFSPLMAYLKTANEGKQHTLPEQPVF